FANNSSTIRVLNNTITSTGINIGESFDAIISNNPTMTNVSVGVQLTGTVTISQNSFRSTTGGTAIGCNPGSGANFRIMQNTFNVYQYGISMVTVSLNEFRMTTISGNNFTNNSGAGIYIDVNQGTTSPDWVISNNTLTGNGKTGSPAIDRNGVFIN